MSKKEVENMKISYLGGAMEVGASAILVKMDNKNILLDCGIRQKKNKDKLPGFSVVESFKGIDAIIISHAHMDHIGSLPIISKEYPTTKIYMNKMTLELTKVLLYDSLKIMNYTEGEIPIYNEIDVLNMLDRVILVPFQNEIEILEDIKLTMYMAGHIAGASCIYLKSKEGTLLYTGDYSLFNQHTISGLSIPKLRPDVIISEATYGDKLHSNREIEEMRLIESVNRIISNKGKVLIPVFALGRSQEVLFILKKAFNKKQIPEVDVYVDGMIKNINRVFLNNPFYLKEGLGRRILKGQNIFYNKYITEVNDNELREKIVSSNKPAIIIASSGMLSGGMSEYYASFIVNDQNNGIILTGYQDEESNGSTLLKLLDTPIEERKLKLNGKVNLVKCSIDKVGLSAHADKQEMKSLLNELKPKYIILGHGDEEIINTFAKDITREIHSNVIVPNPSEIIDIEIRNPRKQIDNKLEYLYSLKSEDIHDFYLFIKDKYGEKLFTKEDLVYIYYGYKPTDEEINSFVEKIIDSIYFTQDRRRYFLFKISDELDIIEKENKEMTAQEIEEILKEQLKKFPYKKISYYLHEKRVVLTFDFPKTIGNDFDGVCDKILEDYGIIVEKNNNINNLACENKIKAILGKNNIDKISYLPDLEIFRIKVYKDCDEYKEIIKKEIGYDIEFILTTKKENTNSGIISTGQKLEQNEAFQYIDNYFSDKLNKPYKKSLKNGGIILSFISYEVGMRYIDEIKEISDTIKYEISINKTPNMNMMFGVVDELLNKYSIEKIKSPSYLPTSNKVSIKIESISDDKILALKNDFLESTGVELIISSV